MTDKFEILETMVRRKLQGNGVSARVVEIAARAACPWPRWRRAVVAEVKTKSGRQDALKGNAAVAEYLQNQIDLSELEDSWQVGGTRSGKASTTLRSQLQQEAFRLCRDHEGEEVSRYDMIGLFKERLPDMTYFQVRRIRDLLATQGYITVSGRDSQGNALRYKFTPPSRDAPIQDDVEELRKARLMK